MERVPTTTHDGLKIQYERAGSGETIVFVGDIGFGAWQWSFQVDTLAGPYETVVWDYPGVGASETATGKYGIDELAAALEAVLRAVEARRVHLIGAGLGGMVALSYLDTYARGRSVTMFGTTPDGSRIDEQAARALYAPVKERASIRESLELGFSTTFLDAQPTVVEQICEWRLDEDTSRETVERQLLAARAFDAGPLYEYTVPALVCHGLDDPVVPVDAGRTFAEKLPRGTFEAVEGKRLCFAEHAPAVNDRVLAFLDENCN